MLLRQRDPRTAQRHGSRECVEHVRPRAGSAWWHVTANEVSPRSEPTNGSATASTPRPTCSRVTTADGRSPGLRVATFRLPSQDPRSQWIRDGRFTAHSCGGSRRFGQAPPALRSLLIPTWEPSAPTVGDGRLTSQFAQFRIETSRCTTNSERSSVAINRNTCCNCIKPVGLPPLIDTVAFLPHGEAAKHEAGKPVQIRRGRATVIGPNFGSMVGSQTSFVINIARTGRAIPGG